MKIEKAAHKALLHNLFYEATDGVVKPKTFDIGKLADASTTAKKLLENSEAKDGRIYFVDGEVKFTVGESAILKELFEARERWEITSADAALELQKLLR